MTSITANHLTLNRATQITFILHCIVLWFYHQGLNWFDAWLVLLFFLFSHCWGQIHRFYSNIRKWRIIGAYCLLKIIRYLRRIFAFLLYFFSFFLNKMPFFIKLLESFLNNLLELFHLHPNIPLMLLQFSFMKFLILQWFQFNIKLLWHLLHL